MTYRVELENRARRQLTDLASDLQDRLIETLLSLRENPRPPGAVKLKGREGYRVRQGDYRILYAIDDRSKLVRIYRIGHRRDVYRGL